MQKLDLKNKIGTELSEDELNFLSKTWDELGYLQEDRSHTQVMYIRLKRQIRQARQQRLVLRFSAAAAVVVVMLGVWGLWFNEPNEIVAESVSFDYNEVGILPPGNNVTFQIGNQIVGVDSKSATLSGNDTLGGKIDIVMSNGQCVTQVERDKEIIVKVPVGHQFQLILSDGTKVWLNSDTEFAYSSTFTGDSRHVKLTGEGYFDVANDNNRPFIVSVDGKYDIKVLGTQFNVSSYKDAKMSRTTLVEGKIVVLFNGNGGETELKPNQQISVDNRFCVDVATVNTAPYTSWMSKQFIFDSELLTDIAERLERCYGIDVEVDPSVADVCFSGRISYNRGLEYFIKLLRETSGINCRFKEGKLLITK